MTGTEDVGGEVPTSESVFHRVVVGIDGTEPGFEACRQAALLADPVTPIEAIAVVHLAEAVRAGAGAPRIVDQLQRDAEAALDEAVRILGERARKRFVNGLVTESLLRELERIGGTVIAIGSHGHHRATEIMIGGVAGEVLHQAPCSVLIARPPSNRETFPDSIVVGLDGSEAADMHSRPRSNLRRASTGPCALLLRCSARTSTSSASNSTVRL